MLDLELRAGLEYDCSMGPPRHSALVALVIACLLSPSSTLASTLAGKLGKAKDEVRTPPPEGRDAKTESDDDDVQLPYDGGDYGVDEYGNPCPPDDPDCGSADGAEVILGYGLGFLFWLPHLVVEGPAPRDGWFGGAPYMDGKRGHMVFSAATWTPPEPEKTDEGDLILDGGRHAETTEPEGALPVHLRLAAEYGHDFDDVYKPSVSLLMSTSLRLEVESGWTYFREETVTGTDWMVVGDANVLWRFAQHEVIEMRSGIGVRLLTDGAWNAGFNFTYGFDVFPVNPIVLSASVDLGNLGYAFVVHGRAQLGVTRFGIEIYAGYDALAIGDVTLHGPAIGLRAWL